MLMWLRYWFYKFFKKSQIKVVNAKSDTDTPVVLRVRGHGIHRFVTVDIGRIDKDGCLVSNWIKSFCVELPAHFEMAELSHFQQDFCFIGNQVPEQWVTYIMNLPQSKLS